MQCNQVRHCYRQIHARDTFRKLYERGNVDSSARNVDSLWGKLICETLVQGSAHIAPLLARNMSEHETIREEVTRGDEFI